MAVISSTIRREGWTGSGNVIDGDKYSIEHLVESDSVNDGPLSVALGAENALPHPIPKAWASYAIGNDVNLYVVLKDRDTKLHTYTDTGALWIVTSKWSKPGEDEEEDDSRTNPLTRPTKYRIEWSNYTRIIREEPTGAGRKIVNSAGDAFADPLEQDDQRPVLVAVRNVSSLVDILRVGIEYKNAVNTNDFYGAGKHEAKVQSITAGDLQEEEGIQFYTMTIRVEFNDESWDVKIFDQGMRYFKLPGDKAAGVEPVAAKDKEGTPLGAPINLQDDGTRLGAGLDAGTIDPPFETYPERDFDGLGI